MKNPVGRGKSFNFLEITNLSDFTILGQDRWSREKIVESGDKIVKSGETIVEIQRSCPQDRWNSMIGFNNVESGGRIVESGDRIVEWDSTKSSRKFK